MPEGLFLFVFALSFGDEGFVEGISALHESTRDEQGRRVNVGRSQPISADAGKDACSEKCDETKSEKDERK
jgi:hypothetical protein